MDSQLRQEYERRYATEMKFFTGRPGIVRAVLHLYGQEPTGRRVVDLGCGSGRSSFAFARAGAQVQAVDFSQEAHAVCQALARVQEPLPLSFHVSDALEFRPAEPADAVFMLDIIEHVPDPPGLLRAAADWLAPGGRIVISCPSFLNLRGVAWMTLQELFGLLMSPSDRTQILPADMGAWARAAGLGCELVAGTCYGWGWTRDAETDMTRRVRLAVRDKREEDAWARVALDEERTDAWFAKASQAFEPLYRWIRDECGVATQPVTTRILEGAECGFDLETVKRYLSDDLNLWHDGSRITDEFLVVTQSPWSALGAICVYELRPE